MDRNSPSQTDGLQLCQGGLKNGRAYGGKFAAGVVDTGGNLPPVSLTPVSTTLVKLVAKFAAGVVDTGGQP